jgi:hypothetical protein
VDVGVVITNCYTKERKMIEFSVTEIALFCWAVLATAYALKWKSKADGSEFLVRVMLERKEVRDRIVEAYEKEFGQNAG